MSTNSISFHEVNHGSQPTQGAFFDSNFLAQPSEYLSPELDAKRIQLLCDISALKQRYDAFIEQKMQTTLEGLDVLRESLIEQLIAAKDDYESILKSGGVYQDRYRNLNFELNKLSLDLKVLKESEPAPQYATKKILQDYQNELTESERKVDEKMLDVSRQLSMLTSWERSLEKAKKTHDDLLMQHADVSSRMDRLSGKSTGKRHDQKTGLQI